MSRTNAHSLPDVILLGKLSEELNAVAVLCYLNTANITERSAVVVICGYTDYNERSLYLDNGAAHVIPWRFDCRELEMGLSIFEEYALDTAR
ncbi:hypothetical protein [Paramagnetospirillum magneticum]|nr:hypothetical protein [Paramagnetospirillum magneticum]